MSGVTRAMTVGIVGTGQIGRAMAHRLLAASINVRFFARRDDVAATLTTAGALRAATIADLPAACDVVVVCVLTDEQLREVCIGRHALLETMTAGSVLVSHTTALPTTVERLAAQAPPDVGVLDAAFSGSPAETAAGQLALLVGGEPAVLEKAWPALACYASTITLVGGVGDGQRLKLINNMLFAAGISLAREAERVLTAAGLDAVSSLNALANCSGRSYAIDVCAGLGGSAPLWELAGSYVTKDVEAAIAAAESDGIRPGILGDLATRAIDATLGDPSAGAKVKPVTDDLEAVKQLKARYCRALDTKNWADLRAVFTEGVTMDTTDAGGGVITGADVFLAYLEVTIGAVVTVHHCHLPEIDFTSEFDASGIWAMEDMLRFPDGSELHGYGHYHETYRKESGQWRISASTLTRLRTDFAPAPAGS